MSISEWLLERGGDLQGALFVVLIVLFLVLETWKPRRTGSMDRRRRWPVNYLLTVLNLLALGALPVSFISAAVWAARHHVGLLNVVPLPTVLTGVVTLLVRAFISFFTHYLNHFVPWFWRVHRVHHLDTEMDVSTTVRFHPLEFVIALLLGLPIVWLVGLSPAVLMVYELLDVAVTLWSHSNMRIPLALDRVLRYLVVTPDLHRIHHSAWKPETNSNFGAVFTIWDLIFGTFRVDPRDGHDRMPLGLDNVPDAEAHRLGGLLTCGVHASEARYNLADGVESRLRLRSVPARTAAEAAPQER